MKMMSSTSIRVRTSAAQDRELVTVTNDDVQFPSDMTLDEARTLASFCDVTLPEDASTHTIEAIQFAVSAHITRHEVSA